MNPPEEALIEIREENLNIQTNDHDLLKKKIYEFMMIFKKETNWLSLGF